MKLKSLALVLLFLVQNVFSAMIVDVENTNDDVRSIAVDKDRAYIANGNTGLSIYDISQVTPTFMKPLALSVYANDIEIKGNYAFISFPTGSGGLTVVEINSSDPTPNPINVATYNATTGYTTDLEVNGDYAYLANHYGGLFIVNLSNPTSPVQEGYLDTNGMALNLDISGNRAYIADNVAGFKIIDITDKSNPTLISSTAIGGFTGTISVVGSVAYVTTNSHQGSSNRVLQTYDISNELSPVLLSTLILPSIPKSVEIVGDKAYIANFSSGVTIVDISNPYAMQIESSLSTLAYANTLELTADRMFIGDGTNLLTADISVLEAPESIGNIDIENGRNIYSSGDYTYLIDSNRRLKIINNSDPSNPLLHDAYTFSEDVQDVVEHNDFLYVISKTKLYRFNAKNKNNITIMDANPIAETGAISFNSIAVKTLQKETSLGIENEDFLFITDFESKVSIYTIDQFGSTTIKERLTLPEDNDRKPTPNSIDVIQKDSHTTALYVSAGQAGIYIYDLNTSDVSNSEHVKTIYRSGKNVSDVTVAGDKVFFAINEVVGFNLEFNIFEPVELNNRTGEGTYKLDTVNSEYIIATDYADGAIIVKTDKLFSSPIETSPYGKNLALNYNSEKKVMSIANNTEGIFYINTIPLFQ